MKKIGIIFAMKEELEELKEKIKIKNEYKIFSLIFYESEINNCKCILTESGIGKVNAARATQILIDNFDVDYIFNVGVAGSITDKVNIGDIVIADKLVHHDFDITSFNHEKGFIPNIGTYINADQYLLKKSNEIIYNNKVHIGTIASGDIFITDENMSKKINNKFNALCVEMEGASIAQVCYLSNVPFLVLRAISDSPNKKNNIQTYEEFLEKSSKEISKFLIQLLERL